MLTYCNARIVALKVFYMVYGNSEHYITLQVPTLPSLIVLRVPTSSIPKEHLCGSQNTENNQKVSLFSCSKYYDIHICWYLSFSSFLTLVFLNPDALLNKKIFHCRQYKLPVCKQHYTDSVTIVFLAQTMVVRYVSIIAITDRVQ